MLSLSLEGATVEEKAEQSLDYWTSGFHSHTHMIYQRLYRMSKRLRFSRARPFNMEIRYDFHRPMEGYKGLNEGPAKDYRNKLRPSRSQGLRFRTIASMTKAVNAIVNTFL